VEAGGLALEFQRVAIIGCGLIGGSIELALREREPSIEVVAVDRGDDIHAAAGADLVVLSAPIMEIIRILPQLAPHLSPDTLVTDTGSTKAAITDAAHDVRFIGGHPVAGAAVGGRSAARADLFAGRSWILTPVARAREEDVARLSGFVERLGARVRLLDPAEHDRVFALVSHLPQLVVSAMMSAIGSHAGEESLALAGAGLRDSSRLASSPPEIWRDIVSSNRENVATALERVIAELQALRDDETGDTLQRTFERAVRWKRTLDDRSI
jgi:prephenate dehydrogenase